ncbi:CYFA0S02e04786g1_1 [Cyberlindnera fabianii]|uniref:Kinesin-like protein n=1 Tax=Cyberlindnera fabianii TaxID=36022 RepID=A0A061ANI1_CYBFA|nr:CYFA0S02e04786g1_1 [Cyberlindnera fabianii]
MSTERESSITVAVRVRPFTTTEAAHLVVKKDDNIFLGDGALIDTVEANKENLYAPKRYAPKGIRKIVDVVDDRMLIFDPPDNNPLAKMSRNVFPHGKHTTRFKEHRFVFDRLFDEDTTQQDVYHNTTRPLLDSVLDGFNSTVFAYGATGCGKTHTISGTVDQPGIIFLTMKELFERIEELQDTKHVDVSLSYLEIYNETIRDLMQPDNGGKLLTLREDANKRITVSNLSTHRPQSVEDVMDMIIVGNRNRTSSPTEANATSSRSHAVLQINVTQKNRTADIKEDHTFATLSIIDLAGSERAAATRNRGGRLQEGANINKSLLALGNCINALCDARRRNHVPYRDSKLTRLLKFSLGGNCKTVMIVCISPSSLHYDETLNTLKYANRAKEIKTKVVRNQHSLNRHVGSYLKMITEQKQEIEELRLREATKLKQELDRYKQKRERVSIGILEFVDGLKQNLNTKKFETLKLKKSLILCKRQILLQQRVELISFLATFSGLQHPLPQFEEAHDHLSGLADKLATKIAELESLYQEESEIDHIMTSSTNGAIRKLSELESWSDYDKLTLDSMVSLIKDSLEKTILFNASVLHDKVVSSEMFQFNFKFTSTNLIQLITHLEHLNTSSTDIGLMKGELQLSIQDFYTGFDKCIDELLSIDHKFEQFAAERQKDVSSEIKIPTSPIRRVARPRPSSPFKHSPSQRLSVARPPTNGSKITKGSSPVPKVKHKQLKKVRWDVPDMSALLDDDSDVNMNDLAKYTDDLDMASKDTIQDESIIDQSISELENAIDSSKKRQSLTSRSLKPGTARRSLSGATTTNSDHDIAIPQGLGAPLRLQSSGSVESDSSSL